MGMPAVGNTGASSYAPPPEKGGEKGCGKQAGDPEKGGGGDLDLEKLLAMFPEAERPKIKEMLEGGKDPV
jgi:hypothetical protein